MESVEFGDGFWWIQNYKNCEDYKQYQGMTQQPIANKQRIRNFEQKIMNRSIADLMCFQGLADYLLQCCSAQAKANTLSLFSLLPILITSILISGPSRTWYLLTAISLLLHQILDIANKKQAYRLQSFSFGTYYFDHMCDTFSTLLIVYIMGTLFQISHNWLWLFVFLFAILPFYMHHLTMYYNQYMCFPSISPATQGLLILEILCVVGFVAPGVFGVKIGGSEWFGVSELFICFALGWLVIFVVLDIRDIIKASDKFNEQLALKNLFVIFVIGYVMFQSSVISPNILNSSPLTFGLYFYSILLCFALIIGQLLLKYASNQKFQQISGNTLCVTAYFTVVYAVCGLGNFGGEVERSVGVGTAVVLAVGETCYYFFRSRKIMKFINEAINE